MGRRIKEPRSIHRERIASAASVLFMEKGIAETSMDDIAKAAGYSKATLYVYFENKEEIAALSEMQIYHDGNEYNAMDEISVDGDTVSYFGEWYSWIGMDIGNQSGLYSVEQYADHGFPEIEEDKTYFEIVYDSPQLFRFYNNRDWVMEDVHYMLYCIDDGQLWYGDSKDTISYHAYYSSDEYPFFVDDYLMEMVTTALAHMAE